MFLVFFALSFAVKPAKTGSVICDMCIDIVEDMIQMIEEGTVEEEIIQYVDTMCEKLPAPYSTLCAAYVNQGIEQVLSMIEQGLESGETCENIGLCATQKSNQKQKRAKGASDSLMCFTCKQFLDYAASKVAQDKIDELIDMVAAKCKTLPSMGNLCDIIKRENVNRWVPLIKSDSLPAEEKCRFWKIC